MLPAAYDKYDIHEDFAIKVTPYSSPTTLRIGAALETLGAMFIKPPHDLITKKVKIKSFDGDKIPLTILQPKIILEPSPCVLYFHGGGFVLGGNPIQENIIAGFTRDIPFKIISVDYRLALDHPFPYGVEDCYATLLWACKNADKLGIDKKRIAVYGDSAGGALAAAVALMARDRKGPEICLQMLIYPVIDCGLTTKSSYQFVDTPVWNAAANRRMWEVYLKGWEGPVSPYASPMKAESLMNLPTSYIETAEFDPLHDEGINYANRLRADGVAVYLNQTKRTIHGYDLIKENEIVLASFNMRINALKAAFIR
jgi:acetyl esterase/lipase